MNAISTATAQRIDAAQEAYSQACAASDEHMDRCRKNAETCDDCFELSANERYAHSILDYAKFDAELEAEQAACGAPAAVTPEQVAELDELAQDYLLFAAVARNGREGDWYSGRDQRELLELAQAYGYPTEERGRYLIVRGSSWTYLAPKNEDAAGIWIGRSGSVDLSWVPAN